MSRSSFALAGIVLAVVGVLLTAAPARAQPPPDLKSLALSPADLDPGWELFAELSFNGSIEEYAVGYFRAEPEPAVLSVGSGSDPGRWFSPAEYLDGSIQEFTRSAGLNDVTVSPAPPPPVGEDAVESRITATVGGIEVQGDVIAWRQGPLLAVVFLVSPSDPDAFPYAQQQAAKIDAVLAAH